MPAATPVRVALDALGGDHAPGAVVAGAVLAVRADPGLTVVLVGPPNLCRAEVEALGEGHLLDQGRLTLAAATQVVTMDEDPARAVRAKKDATVRVAARLVRDGSADAVVSVGSTGAALAAALVTLGRLRGMSRPALAVVIPAAAAPVVLLDVGATTEAGPDLLVSYALAGAALARARLGLDRPRVGLLSVGGEPGKGDETRKIAWGALEQALAGARAEFVGNVEGMDVPLGGVADVVVTDGFTGNVLLKGTEGTFALLTGAIEQGVAALPEGSEDLAERVRSLVTACTAARDPAALGGAVLVGVDGVVVVGHGAARADAVAACVAVASRVHREGLVPQVAADLAASAGPLRRRVLAPPPEPAPLSGTGAS